VGLASGKTLAVGEAIGGQPEALQVSGTTFERQRTGCDGLGYASESTLDGTAIRQGTQADGRSSLIALLTP
jgi:hypothetical protein